MNIPKNFEDVKVGDTVFICKAITYSEGWCNRQAGVFYLPRIVEKVTPKQFAVRTSLHNKNAPPDMFKKSDGSGVKRDNYFHQIFLGVEDQTADYNHMVNKVNQIRSMTGLARDLKHDPNSYTDEELNTLVSIMTKHQRKDR